ncbi:hypothetical protein [Roseovarius albus]|uniref:hypothetical protein n=1 Tax=Roseovarius albus TaxID=1247867 RepID=UPI0022859794|nr:hypothetical protein [Roseovarius albus]
MDTVLTAFIQFSHFAYLREFAAMIAPNINSYSRLTPGYWAPTAATWRVDSQHSVQSR